MRPLAADEMSRLQAYYNETLSDTCVLVRRAEVGTLDDHGQPVEGWVESAPTACGFKEAANNRESAGYTQAPTYDATLRLAVGTDVTNLDRVRLTHRYGRTLDPVQTFTIDGEIERGLAGYVLRLARSV